MGKEGMDGKMQFVAGVRHGVLPPFQAQCRQVQKFRKLDPAAEIAQLMGYGAEFRVGAMCK